MSDLKRTSNEAPLKEVIDRWLKAYGLDGKMKELDVINAWPEMMGTAVAHRTKEITIRNGTLYLKMDFINTFSVVIILSDLLYHNGKFKRN